MGARGAGSNPVQLHVDPSTERMPLKAELGPAGTPRKRTVEAGGISWSRAAPGPRLPVFWTHRQNRASFSAFSWGQRVGAPGVWARGPASAPLALGPPAPPQGLEGRKQAAGVQGPPSSQNRSQLTLQQDSQEGDSSQKSHLVLHGAGSGVGPGWCEESSYQPQ